MFCIWVLAAWAQAAEPPQPLRTLQPMQMHQDLELLQEGLETWHAGMYWTTTREEFADAMHTAVGAAEREMSTAAFYLHVARLVALTREGHARAAIPAEVIESLSSTGMLPVSVRWVGTELVVDRDFRAPDGTELRGHRVLSINGRTPDQLFDALSPLVTRDGFAEYAMRAYLAGLYFSVLHAMVYGAQGEYRLVLSGDDGPVEVVGRAVTVEEMKRHVVARYRDDAGPAEPVDTLHFQHVAPGVAFLAVDTFSSDEFRSNATHRHYGRFLRRSFASLQAEDVHTLVLDISLNGGGSEGNENVLFSYLATNYQKYRAVRVNQGAAVVGESIGAPQRYRIPRLERWWAYRTLPDGSLERRDKAPVGLSAFRGRQPRNAFDGELYVAVGTATYSGGSELANMLYTRDRGHVVGEPTSGGFHGNTSGVSFELALPHSGIVVHVPVIQFEMNVDGLPLGSALIPHEVVVPTIEQSLAGERAASEHILMSLGIDAELPAAR